MLSFGFSLVLGALFFPLAAQKKPVTLDVLAAQQPVTLPSPEWSPDGRGFVYTRDKRLIWFEAATRKERVLLSLDSLEQAATKTPPAERFGWENRRVSERPVQWAPDSRSLLVLAGGDLFRVALDAGGYTQLTATPFAERDPKLSPDGTRLAYRHNHDLYVLDLGTRRVQRLTHDGGPQLLNGELDWVYPEELDLGTAYWWSPDSRRIAYLQFDVGRELVHPHVDMLDVFAKPEPQYYPKAGTPNADVRLGVVASEGGPARWMDLGEVRDRLLARVYWTPDSAALLALRLNRIQNQMHLLRADASSGEARVVLAETDPYWINVKDDLFVLPKRGQLLMGSEKDGYRHLYLFGMDGSAVSQLTRGEWEVTAVARVDEAAGRVWFQSTEESPLERHLYSVSLSGGERRKLTVAKGTHTVAMSPSGEYWLDAFSSVSEPPSLTLRDAAGGAVHTVMAPDRQRLEPYELLPAELVSFAGADGTRFHARLIRPAGFEKNRKYPVVVMVYGGPHAQTVRDLWSGINWDQVLAQRGFIVWQMDNRGSGGRGHLWEAKLHRRFGKQELADQLEGVKYLLGLGFADEKRIGITGWSYGGYMTLTAMLHAPGVFRAGISGAPVTDWRHYDTIYTERYLGLPPENEAGYRDSSPVHFAKNLEGKLLLVHNYGDDNVLYQNNMQMQIALQEAGKQFDLLVYPQKAHGVTGPLTRHMREAMTAFFERHLRN